MDWFNFEQISSFIIVLAVFGRFVCGRETLEIQHQRRMQSEEFRTHHIRRTLSRSLVVQRVIQQATSAEFSTPIVGGEMPATKSSKIKYATIERIKVCKFPSVHTYITTFDSKIKQKSCLLSILQISASTFINRRLIRLMFL
jgi:hypothetical protein